jgi:hypothetical protein
MHPESLAALVNKLSVPTHTARTAAIRQHLLEMPAPVVADALGYHGVPVVIAVKTTKMQVSGRVRPPCAYAVPIMIVPSFGRPETLAGARRAPLPIMNSHPRERQ